MAGLPKSRSNPIVSNIKICYSISVYNRLQFTKNCLNSFRESNPLPGSLILFNDASTEKGIKKLLQSFSLPGIDVHYVESRINSRKKCPQADPWRIASNECLKYGMYLQNTQQRYDYFFLMDNDALFKKDWVQKTLSIYLEAKKIFPIGTFSAFNCRHKYGFEINENYITYSSQYGDYRIRKGANGISYLMSFQFLEEVHRLFDLDTEDHGGDIEKQLTLYNDGWVSMITVPSLVKQQGDGSTSILNHADFDQAIDF